MILKSKPNEINSSNDQDSQRRFTLGETGQMSIFIALMFQVLFVFFAMVINVGLLVHDKINLQNSVDLAAFYGAQRQAELLEEIAHINYQIRQDYKLLTWRYRVIGTLGRRSGTNIPPAAAPDGSPVPPDVPRPPMYPASGDTEESPVVCVAHRVWKEFGESSNKDENYCWKDNGTTTPGIPSVTIVNPFLPVNFIAAGFTAQSQKQLAASCTASAPLNWAFTMQMLYAYRQSIAERKMLIHSFRENLISSAIKDIDGNSIEAGIRTTLSNNLTLANRAPSANLNIQVLNGMTLNGCDGNDGEFMMPEIRIAPLLKYMYAKGGGGEAGCGYKVYYHTQFDQIPAADRKVWDPDGVMAQLASGEPDINNPQHSSLGYEKNPWCMTYMGVKATSTPRKPFAPFGQPVQLTARAFAAPFGGRVGPWYGSRWPAKALMSDSSEANRTDKLTTPRLVAGGNDVQYSIASIPNFSRYPGDTVGMASQLAQAGTRSLFNKVSLVLGNFLSLKFYAGFTNLPETGDPLIWDPSAPPDQPLDSYPFGKYRKAEVAVVAPDLFDATYYSIEPNYFLEFQQRHTANPGRFVLSPIYGQTSSPISDLGSKADNKTLKAVDVESQISTALATLDPAILPALYYPLRNWTHLLTSWAPNLVTNFAFPDSRFGQCSQPDSSNYPIPGKCAAGGRSGYSVRLISREHLRFDDWKIGGDGESPGGIINKPSSDF